MKSGQQLAQENVAKFASWIAEREAADDWNDYIRRGKLNRTTITEECDFALSVFQQNPAVKSDLEALEVRLLIITRRWPFEKNTKGTNWKCGFRCSGILIVSSSRSSAGFPFRTLNQSRVESSSMYL